LSVYGIMPYTQVMATVARTRRIEIRVTEDEHTLEEAAATALGISLSEFYRRAARESAEEVLAERSRIVLDEVEAERFLDALEHPERFEAGIVSLADRPSVIPRS
jgi:uncharacterized protein (DUF1778 family)